MAMVKVRVKNQKANFSSWNTSQKRVPIFNPNVNTSHLFDSKEILIKSALKVRLKG